MPKGIVDGSKQIVCHHGMRDALLVKPSESSGLQHWVVLDSRARDAFRSVAVVGTVDSHAFIRPEVAHGCHGVPLIRVAELVKESKFVPSFNKCLILILSLTDQVRVGLLDLRVPRRVFHFRIRFRNAAAAVVVYFNVDGLTAVGDAGGRGIRSRNIQESWRWPGCTCDIRRTLKRRIASAWYPSSSVSSLFRLFLSISISLARGLGIRLLSR